MRRFAFLAATLSCGVVVADEPAATSVSDEAVPRSLPVIHFGDPPIDYFGKRTRDPVARLQQRLEAGQLTLADDHRWGYLPALLSALDIAPESQILKWNSGSPHREVGPNLPRALYFRDDVVLAYIPHAGLLELAAQDPDKGTLFYTMTQTRGQRPQFERPHICLGCHAAATTAVNVPGFALHTGIAHEAVGKRPWQSLQSHALPFQHRWQAWFVSGSRNSDEFSGRWWNPTTDPSQQDEPPFSSTDYLAPTSDPVALLIHDHWMLGLNLLTRWSQERQSGQAGTIDAALLRYLLMVDEAPLPAPLPESSPFARWFAMQGPRDAAGRSLRMLDLKTKTFRYSVSPLVTSTPWQLQPRMWRLELYRQLQPQIHDRVTLEVLAATVPDWLHDE